MADAAPVGIDAKVQFFLKYGFVCRKCLVWTIVGERRKHGNAGRVRLGGMQ